MSADSTLRLGTIFTGDIDKKFLTRIAELKAKLGSLAKAMEQVNTASAGVGGAKVGKTGLSDLNRELSSYQTIAGASTKRAASFQTVLANIKKTAGDSGPVFEQAAKNLLKIDDAIAKQAGTYIRAGKNGMAYYQTTDRMGIASQITAKKIKLTANGIEEVRKAQTSATAAHVQGTGALKKASAEHAVFKGHIAQIGNLFDRLKNSARVIASYALAGSVIYGFVSALRSGVTTISDFDQSLRNLQAISGDTRENTLVLGDAIKDVARNSRLSLEEVSKGAIYLAQAGFTTGESLAVIKNAGDLAVGTLSDMNETTDLVTTTIRAFSLNASESGRVVDVMATAINKSKLDVDKLRTAFNYIGAAAHQAGISLEETAAATMVLADNGMRASTIGTGLRQVISKLIAPTAKLKSLYRSYGIDIQKINVSQSGFQSSIKELTKVLWNHEKGVVDMGKAYEIFQLRGAQSAAVLIKAYMTGDFQKALEATYEVGSASKMAATQMEGLDSAFKNLVNQVKLLVIGMGEGGLLGILKNVVNVVGALAKGLVYLVQSPISMAIIQITALTGGFLLLRLAVLALIPIVQALAASVIPFLITSMVRVIYTIGGLTGIFGVLSSTVLSSLIPWIGLAAILSSVIVLILKLGGATKAHYQALVKENASITEGISGLEIFSSKLEELNKKKQRGIDVSIEEAGLIARFKHEYPALAKQIDLVTTAYGQQAIALGSLLMQERARNIANLIGQYKDLEKEIGKTLPREFNEKAGPMIDETNSKLRSIAFTYYEIMKADKKWKENPSGFREWMDENLRLRGFDDKGVTRSLTAFDEILNRIKTTEEDLGKAQEKYGVGKAILNELERFKGTKYYDDALNKVKQLENRINSLADSEEKYGMTVAEEEKTVAAYRRETLEEMKALGQQTKGVRRAINKDEVLEAQMTNKELQLLEEERQTAGIQTAEDTVIIKASLERDLAREILSIRIRQKEEIGKLRGKETQEYYDARNVEKQAYLDLVGAELKIEDAKQAKIKKKQAEFNEEIKTAREQYISDLKEEYQEIIDEEGHLSARSLEIDRLLIILKSGSWKQYYKDLKTLRERNIAESGSILDQIRFGITEAQKELKPFGETIIGYAKSMSEEIGSSMTGALLSFAYGTKTAKDAFIDFAKSVMQNITEIIMKEIMMRALLGVANQWAIQSGSGMFGTGETIKQGLASGTGIRAHSGGIVGKDTFPKRVIPNLSLASLPRYHKGLMPNEQAAILKKDEGVFTQEQMAAMGGKTYHVNLGGININAVDAKSFQELAARNPGAIIGPFIGALRRGDRNLIGMLRGV